MFLNRTSSIFQTKNICFLSLFSLCKSSIRVKKEVEFCVWSGKNYFLAKYPCLGMWKLGIAIRIRYDSEFGSFDSLSKICLWIKPIRNSLKICFKTVSDSEICNHNLLFHCVSWLTLERPRFILSALILKIMYWRTVHTIRLNSFEIRKTVSNSENRFKFGSSFDTS